MSLMITLEREASADIKEVTEAQAHDIVTHAAYLHQHLVAFMDKSHESVPTAAVEIFNELEEALETAGLVESK